MADPKSARPLGMFTFVLNVEKRPQLSKQVCARIYFRPVPKKRPQCGGATEAVNGRCHVFEMALTDDSGHCHLFPRGGLF
jgi:hypothetical protein